MTPQSTLMADSKVGKVHLILIGKVGRQNTTGGKQCELIRKSDTFTEVEKHVRARPVGA